jgi:hypothetical protein
MKRHDRFNPELGLAGRVLDVHVRSRFLTREEIEAIAPGPGEPSDSPDQNSPVGDRQINAGRAGGLYPELYPLWMEIHAIQYEESQPMIRRFEPCLLSQVTQYD